MNHIQKSLKQVFVIGLVLTAVGCANRTTERAEQIEEPESRVEASTDERIFENSVLDAQEREGWTARPNRGTIYPLAEVEDRAPASTENEASDTTMPNENISLTPAATTDTQASRGSGFSWAIVIAAIALIIYLGAKAIRARRNPTSNTR